jgi:hypothetical protein
MADDPHGRAVELRGAGFTVDPGVSVARPLETLRRRAMVATASSV